MYFSIFFHFFLKQFYLKLKKGKTRFHWMRWPKRSLGFPEVAGLGDRGVRPLKVMTSGKEPSSKWIWRRSTEMWNFGGEREVISLSQFFNDWLFGLLLYSLHYILCCKWWDGFGWRRYCGEAVGLMMVRGSRLVLISIEKGLSYFLFTSLNLWHRMRLKTTSIPFLLNQIFAFLPWKY